MKTPRGDCVGSVRNLRDLALPFTVHSLVHSRPVPRLCGRSEPRLLGLQPERRQLIRTVPCTKSSPAPWEKLAGVSQTNCLHPGLSLISFVILRELPTFAEFVSSSSQEGSY